MDERIDGAAHCSGERLHRQRQGGQNIWMYFRLVLLRQFTFSLPPRPLNYTNRGLVSAVWRLMATTLFRGTNESVWTSAWAICWGKPASTLMVNLNTWGPGKRAGIINFIVCLRKHKCLHAEHTPVCCFAEGSICCSRWWLNLGPQLCCLLLWLHPCH